MSDPRHVKLASLLVNYCVAVQPGDRVMLSGGHISKPLMTEVYKEVIKSPDITSYLISPWKLPTGALPSIRA